MFQSISVSSFFSFSFFFVHLIGCFSLPSQFEYDVVVMVLLEIKMEVMGNGKHDALEGDEETKEIEELVSLVIVETSIDINSEVIFSHLSMFLPCLPQLRSNSFEA